MDLAKEFYEIRRVGTPWALVNSPDYRAAARTMAGVQTKNAKDGKRGLVWWDAVRGHKPLHEVMDCGVSDDIKKASKAAADELGTSGETEQSPALILKRALGYNPPDINAPNGVSEEVRQLPNNCVLFMVIPDSQILANPAMVQAVANVRDSFKLTRRTLVLLGRNLELPALLAEDVPILNEPLPAEDALRDITLSCFKSAELEPGDGQLDRSVDVLRGLTRFAAEEGVSRCLSRQSGIKMDALAEIQKEVIEASTERSLRFVNAAHSFDDVGGLDALKDHAGLLVRGPRRPSVIVWFDEIEKSISQAAGGSSGPADSSGTSQDMLKTLLTRIEDNGWLGSLFVGGPGTGKSFCCQCIGKTYGIRVLAGDLGATKNSLVGQSEHNIRRMMDVLWSIGGRNVLVVGTCNSIGAMPPALLRRFRLGIWFFTRPNEQERKAIWQIQCKAFGVDDAQEKPDDSMWTGSDIRNCVEAAYILNCSLVKASRYITLSGVVSAKEIAALETQAQREGWLDACRGGPFMKATNTVAREGVRATELED